MCVLVHAFYTERSFWRSEICFIQFSFTSLKWFSFQYVPWDDFQNPIAFYSIQAAKYSIASVFIKILIIQCWSGLYIIPAPLSIYIFQHVCINPLPITWVYVITFHLLMCWSPKSNSFIICLLLFFFSFLQLILFKTYSAHDKCNMTTTIYKDKAT